jgi:hypothetical protein
MELYEYVGVIWHALAFMRRFIALAGRYHRLRVEHIAHCFSTIGSQIHITFDHDLISSLAHAW